MTANESPYGFGEFSAEDPETTRQKRVHDAYIARLSPRSIDTNEAGLTALGAAALASLALIVAIRGGDAAPSAEPGASAGTTEMIRPPDMKIGECIFRGERTMVAKDFVASGNVADVVIGVTDDHCQEEATIAIIGRNSEANFEKGDIVKYPRSVDA